MKRIVEKINYYLNIETKWTLVIFGIICLVLYSLLDVYQKNRMDKIKKGHYTIGFVKETYIASKHKNLRYSYIVAHREYISSEGYNYKYKPIVGKRYLVQYSNEDKSESFLYQNIPVPDSIKLAPLEGWKELPEWAKYLQK